MKVFTPVVAVMAVFALSRPSFADSPSSEEPSSTEAPAPSEARASSEKRPPSGVGLLIGGGIVTGIGGVNLLSAILCSTSSFWSDKEDICYAIAFGAAGVGFAIGIPMLVIGANKRAAYKEWLKDHPSVEGLSVVPLRGGGVIGWSANF